MHRDAVWRSKDNHRRVGLCLPFVYTQSLIVHSCVFQASGLGYSLTSVIQLTTRILELQICTTASNFIWFLGIQVQVLM